jgi:hypothetical protein
MKYLQTIQEYIHNNNSGISSHLDTIYMKVLEFKPKNIVELGVRGGESSKIFNYVNQEIDSNIVGVDIDECDYSFMKNGTFYKANDMIFHEFYSSLYGKNIDVLYAKINEYENFKPTKSSGSSNKENKSINSPNKDKETDTGAKDLLKKIIGK